MSEPAQGPTPVASIESLRNRVEAWVGETLIRSGELGFLGGMPIEDQVDHALGFVSVAESFMGRSPSAVVDLGSGGGIPGAALSSCWPESRIVLLDSSERRTDFLLSEAAAWVRGHGDEVRLGPVEVVRGRAEEFGRIPEMRQQFDLVTARSFGPPAVTAECGAPLLISGGLLIVSEPPEPTEGVRWPSDGLDLLGLEAAARVRVDGRFGYQVLRKVQSTPERYPRRVGIPAKRPLF
jgi:16S rRNA (guanine527-N7)-methyltransferase